jgi:hypothetical protein
MDRHYKRRRARGARAASPTGGRASPAGLTELEVSAVVEQLARVRTQRLQAPLLRRRGLPLAVAALELDGRVAYLSDDWIFLACSR